MKEESKKMDENDIKKNNEELVEQYDKLKVEIEEKYSLFN